MDVFSVCSRWLKKKMCEGRLHMTHLHDASLTLRSNQQVTATPSGDATLPCQAPADTPTDLKLLKWSRRDVTSGYVYFHRDGRLLKEYQHPSYRGRVELSDPEMRNRDVSVVLRNVSNSDAGTYECLVSIKSEQTSRQYVRLTVTDEGHREGDAPAGNKRARIGKVGSAAAGGNKNGYVGLALCVVSALVL
ncbi:hypothetical protein ABVT39_015977 [Epinephelus coioides]